ncbi:MAG: hypothetical protein ACI4TE_06855 [Alphaproteobacteria bacterium]
MKDVALTVRQNTSEKEKRWITSAYGRDFWWSSFGSVAGTVYLGGCAADNDNAVLDGKLPPTF